MVVLYCHLLIHAEIYIYIYWIHTDAMIKTDARRKTSLTNICTSHFICKSSKRVTQGLRVRGSWRPNRNFNILTPNLWPSTLCLSRSSDAQSEALGSTLRGAGFLYFILASSLDPNSSEPQAPSAWCGFPYHISSISVSNSTGTWLPSWLRYIIIQRPLDLWNRMFNRHQAEITVMQFTGHSLPVHQSMSVPWEFFSSSHFISQFPPTRFPLITAIRMCHLLPVHHLGMAFLAGSKGQNMTVATNDITYSKHAHTNLIRTPSLRQKKMLH